MPEAAITPSASAADVSTARGVLGSATAEQVVLEVPGTDYRLHLVPTEPVSSPIGKKVRGVIRAQARRIDVVKTGGRFVEPVYGRPRRIQGTVVAVDPAADTVTVVVYTGVPIVCKTNGLQRASEFREGMLVSFDAAPGATFTPAP